MPRYVNKPSLADLARRRGQSIFDVLKDWGLDLDADGFENALAKRCHKEGVLPVTIVTSDELIELVKSAPQIDLPKNALVELPKQESALAVGKKFRKNKVTLDESNASDKHVGMDPHAASGPKDPT